jgi:hypothetical protein
MMIVLRMRMDGKHYQREMMKVNGRSNLSMLNLMMFQAFKNFLLYNQMIFYDFKRKDIVLNHNHSKLLIPKLLYNFISLNHLLQFYKLEVGIFLVDGRNPRVLQCFLEKRLILNLNLLLLKQVSE